MEGAQNPLRLKGLQDSKLLGIIKHVLQGFLPCLLGVFRSSTYIILRFVLAMWRLLLQGLLGAIFKS